MTSPVQFAPAGRVRAALYRSLWAASRWLPRRPNPCLYLAAGLLRRDDIDASIRSQWLAFAAAVDDADEGLLEWEARLYSNVLRPSDRLLLVGCGSGRDVIALRRLAYEVVGVDVSDDITDLARNNLKQRAVVAEIRTGRIEQVDLNGHFDAVIFSQRCYGNIQQSAVRVAMLRRLVSHLPEGGRVVIPYRARRPASQAGLYLTYLSCMLSRAGWRPELGDVFSDDHRGMCVLRYEHHFRPESLVGEVEASGLRVVSEGIIRDDDRYAVARVVSAR